MAVRFKVGDVVTCVKRRSGLTNGARYTVTRTRIDSWDARQYIKVSKGKWEYFANRFELTIPRTISGVLKMMKEASHVR